MQQVIVVTLLLCACGTLKVNSFCESEGIVILSDQLDGCEWLIETIDGRKLLPQNGNDYDLVERQRIYFSYVPFDGVSICMSEDEIITLTCFQRKGDTACDDDTDWQAIGWLNAIIENQEIRLVDRFTRGPNKLYQITSSNGFFAWYHCDGIQICNSRDGCSVSAKDLSEQVTIFLAHR